MKVEYAAALLLAMLAGQGIFAAVENSLTYDEIFHSARGYSVLKTWTSDLTQATRHWST